MNPISSSAVEPAILSFGSPEWFKRELHRRGCAKSGQPFWSLARATVA